MARLFAFDNGAGLPEPDFFRDQPNMGQFHRANPQRKLRPTFIAGNPAPVPSVFMFRWYYWVSGFFLLNAMAAFGIIDRLVYGTWDNKPGDKITQTLGLLLILASVALFVRGYRSKNGIGAGGLLALATIAFLFLSAGWSLEPAATVRQAVLYLFVVLGSIGIANTLDGNDYMDLLRRICFWSAIASLFLLAVSPSNAGSPGVDFQGIFPHKNFLGQVMATGVLASLHVMRVDRRRRIRNIFNLFVFIGVALASASATACLAIFAFCCANWIISLLQRGPAGMLIGTLHVLVLVPIVVVVAVDPSPILEMIGKDPTLTGRTEIWNYVIDAISLKPLLGWGYFGFWTFNNPTAVEISETVRWIVPQAHNGLLEMLLNVGVVGTAIFIFLFLRNVTLAIRCFGTPAKELAITTITVCIGILTVGISETVLLAANAPWTSMFFITGLMCEQAVRAAKPRQYRGIAPRGRPSHFRRPSFEGPVVR
jgi:exopolysaccharide production protein ExoQ